ncbi:hypothetical protein ABT352_07910 [Streptosporangium sp. NPDC000563]|uniref:hypothetical protein n=1 Tax=Streptosporangium sp. NPDC000563 TaxID=3154366 RepID=UPI0033200413
MVRRFARHGAGAVERDLGELSPNAHHAVHPMAGSLEPGLVGIRRDRPWSGPDAALIRRVSGAR